MMSDIERVKRNIGRMIDGGATEQEIDLYLDSEGVTKEQLKESGTATERGNYIDNIARRVASGMTFGFADEIAARANEAMGRGDYVSNVAQERARDKAFMDSNPVAATIAEIGGSLLSPITKLTGAAAEFANLPRYARYFVEGASLGALSGAGNETEGNRDKGAAIGGALGGALGTAIPAGLEALGKGAQIALQRIMQGPVEAYARKLSNAFMRDGLTIPEAQARLEKLGPESVMADLGGNVRGLAETVAQMPGKAMAVAHDTLSSRASGQGERIIQRAFQAAGVNSLDDIIRLRSQEARPLYEAAFARPYGTITANSKQIKSPVLDRLLPDREIQAGIRAGIRDVEMESRITGLPMRIEDYALRRNPETGQIEKFGTPTLRLWDAAKRGLDIKLNTQSPKIRDPKTGRLTQYGMRLEGYRKLIINELDRLTTDENGYSAYKNAREAWSGPTAIINGLSYIDDVVSRSRDGSDITGRLFGSPAARERLRPLFPDEESFSAFANAIAAEKTFAETRRQVLGNSRTAYRHAAADDLQNSSLTESALNLVQNPSLGGFVGEAMRGARNYLRRPPIDVADKLAEPLFSTDPRIRNEAFAAMQRRLNVASDLNSLLPLSRMGLLGASRIGGYSGGLLGGSNQ
jgi:hypothetical protein